MNLLLVGVFALIVGVMPGLPASAVNILAALLVMPLSYIVNRLWVFRSSDPVGPQSIRFFTVYMAAVAAGGVTFALLHWVFRIPEIWAQVWTVALVVSATFAIQTLWTFAPRGVPATDGPG